jgi:luciferase family oxidoreductase group 1
MRPPLSVLDLVPIKAGGDAGSGLRESLELAQLAERLGYRRYWVAEHHNMPGVASAATAVVIAHLAAGTERIRVGSGGVMLPNHAPYVIAEQFGTLAALHPGRIDLGLGRAPGTDQVTTRALRRDPMSGAEQFPQDVVELMRWFEPAQPGQAVRAVPGEGADVEMWLLGSSLYSAQLAAALGLPFAFAAHFAPDLLMPALSEYRTRFRPVGRLAKPHATVCVQVFAADTDAEAQRLFTSLEQAFIALRQGRPGPLPPPVDVDDPAVAPARAALRGTFRYAVVGGPERVRARLADLLQTTGADEVMVTAGIHDQAARLRSFELAMEAWQAVHAPEMA